MPLSFPPRPSQAAPQATNTADTQPTPRPAPTILRAVGHPPHCPLCSGAAIEGTALAEKDLPDVFQNIILRVLPACPLCISTSARSGWERRAAVAAYPRASCASRSLAWR